MSATIIVATDQNWLIGDRPDPSLPGETPWQGQLPIDMNYFAKETDGKLVIMTSPTFRSIPKKFRPLKNRTNVIWTRQEDLHEEGTTTVHSLDEAFEQFPDQELMICGGGHLYGASLQDPRIDMILRTLVDGEFEGNVHFPILDKKEWVLIHSDHYKAEGKNLHDCTFETYVRREAMIVDPRNGRTPNYKSELVRIQRARLCPFCPGGKTLTEGKDPVIAQNSHWIAIDSHTPVKGAKTHWVIFPKKHKTRLSEVTVGDWHMFTDLLNELKKKFDVTGGAVYIREGDSEITGATVLHLHLNYVVPDNEAEQAVCVFFGQYKKP